MKVAIMQPYLFPYIGYWQLINAVDKFVLLDDVNYIVRGYINRNSILLNGEPFRFSIPIKKASQNRLIKDTELNFSNNDRERFLRTLETAYKRADYFEVVMPLIRRIVDNQKINLTEYIEDSIKEILSYVGVSKDILISSQLEKNTSLTGQERIIEICRQLEADTYINPCGGRKLYDRDRFKKDNINLLFIDSQTDKISYKQCGKSDFIPNLSVIDILMNVSPKQIQEFLKLYDLSIK